MLDRVKNTAKYILAGVAGLLLLAIIGFVELQRIGTKSKSNPRQSHHERDSISDSRKLRHQDEQSESDDRPVEDESGNWDEYKTSITVVYFIVALPMIYQSFAQSWNDLVSEIISNLIRESTSIPTLELPESYFFAIFPLLAAELSRGGVKKLYLRYSISRQKAGALSGIAVAILAIFSGFEQLRILGTLVYTGIFTAATAYLGITKKKWTVKIPLYAVALIFSIIFLFGILVNVG